MKQELLTRIYEIMAAVFEIAPERLGPESSPDLVEAWDSVRHMNLVMELERALDVQFSAQDIMEMMSVELIVEIVSQRKAGA